ncbi:endonuclease/exonuclease/phosphatase family protein [Novosphingobium sp. Leaf2]|uniref:endonuclease/exonuclease/phosphatase family protein n=1 Tax=Novosphingobium sp. Leaf2 TaxID=1735670 RepID=UPI0006F6F484|nr:endonuclease/exonuclease/phosphatase family protein [Novosphingobium sp. Leaf2]KQM13406.1 endonuclease [Novosphingobium sp. Leaf2]
MKRLHITTLGVVAAILALNVPLPSPAADLAPAPISRIATQPTNTLSVMTYNVEGLPFPAAFGRPGKLAQIGQRLGALRETGQQPHVVLLQEAFIGQAKAIARAAGYTYVAWGPKAGDMANDPSLAGKSFAAQDSWLKGEGVGKWVDSGLVILSDYPIVQTRRMAFPADMCAGYDCLASKGVLLTWIQVPGHSQPIAIADTHLNSRAATGVEIARADTAYMRQIATARDYIHANVAPGTDVIFGGDFNIGHDPQRIAAVAADGGIVNGGVEATQLAASRSDSAVNEGLAVVRKRAKDKQFFRAGAGSELSLQNIVVPVGFQDNGTPLSDHTPYIADYTLG